MYPRIATLLVLASTALTGSAQDTGIARPEPGSPVLPAQLYGYADADIDLPLHFTNRGGRRDRGGVARTDTTPADNPVTNAGATLGRVLFYDTRLSANDTKSCASCHIQEYGFSDPEQFSEGFDGGRTGRHSMGLANARYYNRGRFFWDERAATLEDQVLMPIQDKVEMGMTLDALETKLAAADFYPPLFEAAFGSPEVGRDGISRALAQFVRSMVSYNSRYDQAFDGTRPDFNRVFTAEEQLGSRLFGGGGRGGRGGDGRGDGRRGGRGRGRRPGPDRGPDRVRSAGCVRCHGTAAQVGRLSNNGLDRDTSDDQGAGRGRFKVPSLRNIAVTAPYMHDGRFATLREVIEHYNSGVQSHPNLDRGLGGRNRRPRRLNLNNREIDALVAFMTTLTDESFLTDPKFSNPFEE